MQTMNTDQPTFFPNSAGPHPATAAFYMPSALDQQYTMRNPTAYPQSQRMPSPYYNPQMPNNYGQIYVSQPFVQTASFHASGPRGMSTFPGNVPVIRPPNEVHNGTSPYIQQQGYTYSNNNMQQQPNMYPPQLFYTHQVPQPFPMQQQTPTTQISNQQPIPQSQYPAANTQAQTQSSQASQQSSNDQQHGASSQPTHERERRQRKPLAIVDPVSHQTVVLETPNAPTNAPATTTTDENRPKDSNTDSTVTNVKPTDDVNTTQIRADFRKQFAELLHPNAPLDKNANQPSTDDQSDAASTKEKPAETIAQQSKSSSRSSSISGTKSPTSTESTADKSSEKVYPGIRTRSITEDKSNPDDQGDQINSEKQPETAEINSKPSSDNNEISSKEEIPAKSQSTSSLSPTESSECFTPPQTPTQSNNNESEPPILEISPSGSKRKSYTIQELLNKRCAPGSQKRPVGLKTIDGVTNPNTTVTRQSSVKNYQGGRGSSIQIEQPELHNRVEDPYKLADKNRLDASDKFVRDVTNILNKVTPQTYDKLLQQLDELELNSYERLDGMIVIIFSKAVVERSFCPLYAKLCKHFQKKQVTVPNEDGTTVTHFFRQILLTRCQKGFEGDYRQDIDYDKRKLEVEAITDEKKRKEEDEQLAEDLHKAKLKKIGNIFFIGELFKLQMLIDTIMYDCIEYLIRDKTDEESLESLCQLLKTIGKEIDAKAGDKTKNRKTLEKHYADLESIITQRQTSARIRFMIQDLLDLRRANWVARRVEAKPQTIDEIHEQERVKREQQERDQERDRQQRREQNRGGQQQYTESRGGSRGSGIKQQSNRTDDDRSDRPFTVNSVRQLQTNDKRNSGPIALNLAPQGAWSKGSGVDKKPEDDRSNAARTSKPPAGPVQQLRTKTNTSPGTPGYPVQRQSSRELARENSHRDRGNAMESLRRQTSANGIAGQNNMTNSHEGSRNASREQSRNASRESSVSERTSNPNTTTSATKTSAQSTTSDNTPFDTEKTQTRVRALIEEYTENYSDNNDRPVNEAIEDLTDFCTSNKDQQAIIVQELFTNVLEAKPRGRKAVGHLLETSIQKKIINEEGFLAGFKLIVEAAPDYAVDIPLIWQYIGEIVGAFIGAPSSNMSLLKPILQSIPDEKSKQFFQYIIRHAVEFSSKSRIQRFWQSTGFSLNDLLKSNSIDSSFLNEYSWLSDTVEAEPLSPLPLSTKENLSPRADPQLVKLFKSVNNQGPTIDDAEIIAYIEKNMDPKDKFYIRNIVLSYLEACLINREPQKKIQEDIAKKRMTILNKIIDHKLEAELQAVYAIQNFVNKLEHPPKMAQLLFDIFYDEECVTEDAFFAWLKHPDQSETEGHSVVEISTKDFFIWLQQADPEGEEEES